MWFVLVDYVANGIGKGTDILEDKPWYAQWSCKVASPSVDPVGNQEVWLVLSEEIHKRFLEEVDGFEQVENVKGVGIGKVGNILAANGEVCFCSGGERKEEEVDQGVAAEDRFDQWGIARSGDYGWVDSALGKESGETGHWEYVARSEEGEEEDVELVTLRWSHGVLLLYEVWSFVCLL